MENIEIILFDFEKIDDIDEVSVYDNEYSEEEPLGYWDKQKVMGGNSPLAGTPDGLAGPTKFTLDIGKGTVDGFNDFAEDTIEGLATTVAHPIETGDALWNAATNPKQTFNVMTDAISTSYDRDVTNGNAESRSRWFTYAATTLATTVGTGGTGAAPRAGTTAAKLGTKPVVKKPNRLNINNPFEPKPALNAGNVDIPYNVYNENWITNQTFQFAKKFDDGKNKIRPHAKGDLTKGMVKTAKDFEKSLVKLPPAERVAAVKTKSQEVAKNAGLVKDSKLSKINGRDVYKDPKTRELYSVDTQHGRFEKTNKKGKHEGEFDFDFMPTKPADSSGGHDLRVN